MPDLELIKKRLAGREYARHEPASPGMLAAVGLILKPGDRDAEILLIRRAERPGDPWSGHMGLPGGRVDPGDADLYATVLRETREEVGVDLNTAGRLIGRLGDLPAFARGKPTGMVIAPYVFELTAEPPLSLNQEVDEALWVSLGPMARGEINAVKEYHLDDADYVLPAYAVQGHIVWGLTYLILQDLFSKLDPT